MISVSRNTDVRIHSYINKILNPVGIRYYCVNNQPCFWFDKKKKHVGLKLPKVLLLNVKDN